jgi:transcription elongation factor GreA
MTEKPVYVTEKGLASLQDELEEQSIRRAELVEQLHEAKEGSDWMDNTEYRHIQDELAFIEARIQELEKMLSTAQIIEPDEDENTVSVGDTVVIQSDGEMEQYTIVGVAEADPAKGLISNESPLARALLNHQVGEEVTVEAPRGSFRVQIMVVKSGLKDTDPIVE